MNDFNIGENTFKRILKRDERQSKMLVRLGLTLVVAGALILYLVTILLGSKIHF